MSKKIIKIGFHSILYFMVIGVLYLNYALYFQPTFQQTEGGVYNQSVYNQLQFLKDELQNGADTGMQNIFPEGFVFINALYGLSWCEMIGNMDSSSPIYKEGMAEISQSINRIDSPEGKEVFNDNLVLTYGAFYRGWSNYLLGKKLIIQPKSERDSIEINLFKQNCVAISKALSLSQSPYLASYEGQTWPADGVVLVASVALHDKIFAPIYENDIAIWLTKVKSKLDATTGLIPHSVYAENGNSSESARGSSQSLILNFLKDIDTTFAKAQFAIYFNLFADQRLGLPGIREYPKGQSGNGDIDSGPVIWGIGGAASIVGQRTMGLYEKWTIYEGLRNSIEGFGAGYTWHSKKKYIFGQLPMADAFIVWSNSIEKRASDVMVSTNWRMQFQLISVVLVIILGYFIKK